MPTADPFVLALAQLFDQAARLVTHAGFGGELHPVQWSALRYFARVGGTAATVKGLAAFQGTTAGPASRTVGAILAKGLVEMAPDPADGRRRLIRLTKGGLDLLARDPMLRLVDILGALPPDQRSSLGEALEQVVLSLLSDGTTDTARL